MQTDKHKNTLVSIIIPAYNYARYMGECLESVLKQTYPHWECIVVDNGSTDDTAELVKTFVQKDDRIQYYFTQQKGVSFARNMGVELCKGAFILPLDADDKIGSEYLEKAVNVLKENEKIKLVYCEAELFGASSGKWSLPEYSLHTLLIENSIFSTALFRKQDFLAAGGYNEEMKEGFEDWDFWIRMLKSGGKVVKLEETFFYYRIKANSRNSVLDKQKQLNLRKKIYENHKELYEQYFSLPELIFENALLVNELKAYKRLPDYKVGSFFLAPLRFLKKIIKS